MRLFLAINLDNGIKGRINDLSKEFSQAINAKFVEMENIHVTLFFLGEVVEEKAPRIVEALEGIEGRSFEMELKGIGAFPSFNFIRVLWVGVEKGREEVIELHSSIENRLKSLGFKSDKSFVPHATFARVKSIKNREKLRLLIEKYREEEFGTQKVESFELMRSKLTPRGPIYSVVHSFRLG